ncbi:MAG: hypothetical protein LBL07_07995 [Tannerella sp.]|jgi:hypothetical protein|nr:hypothetical protein [Tannerella sp.]
MYYYFKKTLFLFFFPAFLGLAGCGGDDLLDLEGMTVQEIQGLFVGEWKETERIDPGHPDIPISASDITIVFSSDGTFQGRIIGYEEGTKFSLDRKYLRTENATGEYKDRYLYSFTGKNKLTLDRDSGISLFILPFPTVFVYKRIK